MKRKAVLEGHEQSPPPILGDVQGNELQTESGGQEAAVGEQARRGGGYCVGDPGQEHREGSSGARWSDNGDTCWLTSDCEFSV